MTELNLVDGSVVAFTPAEPGFVGAFEEKATVENTWYYPLIGWGLVQNESRGVKGAHYRTLMPVFWDDANHETQTLDEVTSGSSLRFVGLELMSFAKAVLANKQAMVRADEEGQA